jgi:ribonuclease Z
LGTSGAFPTAGRNGTAHAVWVQGETLLLDCGEATQRQLRRSHTMRMGVNRIFLSHLHLDHTLGLTGYVGTMDLLDRKEPLFIYTPAGTRAGVQQLLAPLGRPHYEIRIEEVSEGVVVKADGFRVLAARVDHMGACVGYRIEEDERPGRVDVERAQMLGIEPGPLIGKLLKDGQVTVGGRVVKVEESAGPRRPGRSVVFSGDTRPCESMVSLARHADLLIHESTFTGEFQEEARSRFHSTSVDAATIAKRAGVKRLALTHISQRHQEHAEIQKMLAEARAIFPETFLPSDLDEVEIPLAN